MSTIVALAHAIFYFIIEVICLEIWLYFNVIWKKRYFKIHNWLKSYNRFSIFCAFQPVVILCYIVSIDESADSEVMSAFSKSYPDKLATCIFETMDYIFKSGSIVWHFYNSINNVFKSLKILYFTVYVTDPRYSEKCTQQLYRKRDSYFQSLFFLPFKMLQSLFSLE